MAHLQSLQELRQQEVSKDPIQAVVQIRTELPRNVDDELTTPQFLMILNKMAVLGAITLDNDQRFIGSRLTVFEREQAWNLYLPFLFFTIVSGSDSHLEALQTKTSGDYHLLFFGVNILNAVCFEAIILARPRQSGFLTIIDKPQPDGARRIVGYGQAHNRKIEANPDGNPRTQTDPAIDAGSEENRFNRCNRGAKQRRPHSDGKSCLIRSDRLPD
jgi:hypothetical protein